MKHGEARFLSCMYVLSLTLLAVFAIHGLRQTAAVSGVEMPHKTVILDAGHGGMDGGAVAADGTKESQLNLAITLKTEAVLGLLGEDTILIRDTDTELSDAEAQSISQKKVSDIRNRVSLVNSHPEALLLSIHCNTFSEGKYHGAQVFYGNGAKNLAEMLQDKLRAHVDSENLRECKAVSPEVYLFRHIEVPGVLVECGFLSNSEELAQLKSEDYQKRLAVTIGVTVANYLAEDDSGV